MAIDLQYIPSSMLKPHPLLWTMRRPPEGGVPQPLATAAFYQFLKERFDDRFFLTARPEYTFLFFGRLTPAIFFDRHTEHSHWLTVVEPKELPELVKTLEAQVESQAQLLHPVPLYSETRRFAFNATERIIDHHTGQLLALPLVIPDEVSMWLRANATGTWAIVQPDPAIRKGTLIRFENAVDAERYSSWRDTTKGSDMVEREMWKREQRNMRFR